MSGCFDPLFTTTKSRNDPLGSGMGLGLSLVRRSAEVYGGSAELVAPPSGFSTCFRVRLPMLANRRIAMNNHNPSILLVDDDIQSITRLQDRLKPLLDNNVELVVWQPTPSDSDTREAFERHITNRPVLVVTDYDLTTSVRGFLWSEHCWLVPKSGHPGRRFFLVQISMPYPKSLTFSNCVVPANEEQAAIFIAKYFQGLSIH